MKMFATIILLSLTFSSIVHVVEGRRQCHPCADIRQLRAQLGKLNKKLEQVNATLHEQLASGGGGGSGGSAGGSGGTGSSLSKFLLSVFLNADKPRKHQL